MEDYYVIYSSNGEEKGKAYADDDLHCEIESCTGTQYVVEWDDGEITICCDEGLRWIDEMTAQIM